MKIFKEGDIERRTKKRTERRTERRTANRTGKVEQRYLRTDKEEFDVDVMSRKDILLLGTLPLKRFRADHRLQLLNRPQLLSTLVSVLSILMATAGVNNITTTYIYMKDVEEEAWGCLRRGTTQDFVDFLRPGPPGDIMALLVWLWISCGLWTSILPFIAGVLMNCSSSVSSSNDNTYFGAIFYNSNFRPKNPRGVKWLKVAAVVMALVAVVLSVVDVLVSLPCYDKDLPLKVVVPVVVIIISIVIVVIIILSFTLKQKRLNKDENLHIGHTKIRMIKYPTKKSTNTDTTLPNTQTLIDTQPPNVQTPQPPSLLPPSLIPPTLPPSLPLTTLLQPSFLPPTLPPPSFNQPNLLQPAQFLPPPSLPSPTLPPPSFLPPSTLLPSTLSPPPLLPPTLPPLTQLPTSLLPLP